MPKTYKASAEVRKDWAERKRKQRQRDREGSEEESRDPIVDFMVGS